MGLYARYLLPRLTHMSMGQKQLLPYRQRVVTGAAGRVLEIGIGSGLNLPLYGDAVEELIGIDISPELLAMAERAAAMVSRRRLRVRLLEGSFPMHYRRWQRRHGGRHPGAVQRPRCHGGARRGAPCAPPWWVDSVR